MTELMRCALAFVFCWLVGAAIVRLVSRRLEGVLFHSTALMIGLGAVSLDLYTLGALGVRWSVWLVVVTCLPVVLAAGLLHWYRQGLPRLKPGFGGLGDLRAHPVQIAATLSLFVLVGLATVDAALLPASISRTPDGYNYYLLKARMFYIDGGILAYFRDQLQLPQTVPDHPLLTTLLIDWLDLSAGGIQDHLGGLANAAFLIALVGVFFGLARRFAVHSALAAVLSLLLATELYGFIELVGYADVALSGYILIGAGYTALFLRGGRTGDAILGALGFGLAGWTKNEGIASYYAATASFCIVVAARTILRRHWTYSLIGAVIVLVAPYVMLLPWTQLKAAYGVDVIHLSNAGSIASRMLPGGPIVIAWLAARAVLAWQLLLALGVIAIAARLRRPLVAVRKHTAEVYLLLLLVSMLAAYIGGILASPDPLQDLLTTATGRLVRQVTPLFFILLAAHIGPMLRVRAHDHAPERTIERSLNSAQPAGSAGAA